MTSRVNGPGSGAVATDRSPGEIVKDIVQSAQDIIRSEVRLAKAEIREESRKAVRAGVSIGAGAVMALYGIGFLLAAIAAVLSLAMPWWVAASIVGGALSIAGVIGINTGLRKWKQVNPTPERTIADVKENVKWLKRQTR